MSDASVPKPSGEDVVCMQGEEYSKHGIQSEDEFHASRTAARQAVFFLPHLRSGIKLLDCGCGPGSITLDLARHVALGDVVGIDQDESALTLARESADQQGIDNVRFETSGVYELPFADSSFDAVFSHAMLEHLSDPVAALQEMHRVLAPGGVAGVRTPDIDGILWTPADPLLVEWGELARRQIAQSGGDMCRGKQLRRFVRESGYSRREVSASYEVYATPEATQMQADRQTGQDSNTSRWLENRVIDEEKKAKLDDAWSRWAADPDAFLAIARVEAVAWKE